MKIAIIGGHLSPALAVIDSIKKERIIYIGRKYALEGDQTLSLEYQTIAAMRIPFFTLNTGRLQRHISMHTISSLLKVPNGFYQGYKLLTKERPDVILSFGGYVSVPICLAGFFLHIPVVIHEQTLESGLANRIIALVASVVCISWESSRRFFPKKKTVLTGNPTGRYVCTKKDCPYKIENEKKIPVITITGGSTGSRAINTLVENGLQELLSSYILIHQTGDSSQFSDFIRLEGIRKGLPRQLKKRYFLFKFIEPSHIDCVYKQATLVVTRSGINTVTKLLQLEKPSLLIPLAVGQHNEQYKNAELLKKENLGEIIPQESLTPNLFIATIKRMIENIDKYKNTKAAFYTILSHDAAKKIIKILYEQCQYHQKKT